MLLLLLYSCLDDNKSKEHYPDGQIKKECTKDGDNIEKCIEYYQTGYINSEYTLKNGALNGEKSTFNIEGRLTSIVEYINDKKHGKALFYDSLPGDYKIFNVANDFLNGNHSVYKDSILFSSCEIENDTLIGFCNYYNNLGDIIEMRELLSSGKGAFINQRILYENDLYDSLNSYWIKLYGHNDNKLKLEFDPYFQDSNDEFYWITGHWNSRNIDNFIAQDTISLGNNPQYLNQEILKYSGGLFIEKTWDDSGKYPSIHEMYYNMQSIQNK